VSQRKTMATKPSNSSRQSKVRVHVLLNTSQPTLQVLLEIQCIVNATTGKEIHQRTDPHTESTPRFEALSVLV